MRFYLITTHICYCGEESYYYVKVNADGKVMDVSWDITLEEYADYLAKENANEWRDNEAELDFDEIIPHMRQKLMLTSKGLARKSI